MRKVRSFTLIELAVSLLISSLAIAITVSGFLFFKRQFESYRAKSDLLGEFQIFRRVFGSDILKADKITDSLSRHIFLEKGGEIIEYLCNDGKIIRRTAASIDSFNLNCNKFISYYYSQTSGLIEEIDYEFLVNGELINWRFSKMYSARQLLEAERRNDE